MASMNSNEAVYDDAAGHGVSMQHNEPVALDEEEVEGHALTTNANEAVDEDDDVEGHGLLRNAAIAAALTVGGGVAMAGPAAAGPVEDATTIVNQAATPEAVSAFIWDNYGRSVPPEKLQGFIWDNLPVDLRDTGSVEQVAASIMGRLGFKVPFQYDPAVTPTDNVTAYWSSVAAGSKPAGIPVWEFVPIEDDDPPPPVWESVPVEDYGIIPPDDFVEKP